MLCYRHQAGLDDYENAMYAALIGDLDHVSYCLNKFASL